MTILLALLTGLLAWRLWAHHRAVRLVQRALAARQLILREKLPSGKGGAWEDLLEVANTLIADTRRLDHLRSTQHSQLQATLDSIQEAVLILDEENHIRLANPAVRVILPAAGDAIVGQRLEAVLHSPAFHAFVAEARRGARQVRREFEFHSGDRTLWLEAAAARVQPLRTVEEAESARAGAARPRAAGAAADPAVPTDWTLLVLHDITRQKHLEGVRKDFVANVSHELRTPLSVIKGYVETLVDEADTMTPADRTRFLATVQRHAERLHRIVEDLLVLSRLESEAPGLHCETTDLGALLTTIATDYAGRGFAVERLGPGADGALAGTPLAPLTPSAPAPTHRLLLELPADLPLFTLDPLRMTQVCGNLLDNALKYTPPGSIVRLAACRTATGAEITVADNGPGIGAADLPRLFERFYRVDRGRSRDTGGTGLGLSIVKHIVQLHGGHVTVTSRQAPTTDPAGSGTTFTVHLPSGDTAPRPPSAPVTIT